MTYACRPVVDLPPDEVVDLVAPRLRLGDGLDREPSWRHLAHDRDVEIAVGRERERARNRRGGHDQHVRMQALGPERRALQHAEPVLLVDDDETELAEADRILHQRMRADGEMDRTAGELRLQLAPLLRRRGAGQERDPKPRRLEQLPDRDEVLLGENFGRRHERDLEPVLHRDERREQRDDRLARIRRPPAAAGSSAAAVSCPR